MFQFDLPSAILKKRAAKFDSVSLNWHYIELLVKIFCIFLVYCFFLYYVCFISCIMYASTYGWIKMNILSQAWLSGSTCMKHIWRKLSARTPPDVLPSTDDAPARYTVTYIYLRVSYFIYLLNQLIYQSFIARTSPNISKKNKNVKKSELLQNVPEDREAEKSDAFIYDTEHNEDYNRPHTR